MLVFDELINYPEFEQHELKALLEFQQETGRTLRVMGTSANYVYRDAEAVTDAMRRQRAEREGT